MCCLSFTANNTSRNQANQPGTYTLLTMHANVCYPVLVLIEIVTVMNISSVWVPVLACVFKVVAEIRNGFPIIMHLWYSFITNQKASSESQKVSYEDLEGFSEERWLYVPKCL